MRIETGDTAGAIVLLDEADALARQIAAPAERCSMLAYLAYNYHSCGREKDSRDLAAALLPQIVALPSAHPDDWQQAEERISALEWLAQVAARLHDRALVEQALALITDAQRREQTRARCE
jgi:hypothetical protein